MEILGKRGQSTSVEKRFVTRGGLVLGGLPDLMNIQKTMERSTIFNGKTHYFDWASFNSYVKLPEGRTYEMLITSINDR